MERTNFSVIPSTDTLGLRVVCAHPTLGKLEPQGFSSLHLLQELVIDGCSFHSIPENAFSGLSNLTKLTVRTNKLGLTNIESGAFNNLTQLTHLDISMNSIRSLPTDEICKLSSVIHLNVSNNEIGSASDLISSSSCLPSLRTLDLSKNEIISLEPGASSSIQFLSLSGNYIRFVSPDVFANMSVHVLDLSDNQINHLPPLIFHGLPLQEVNLANNSLSSLSPDTFQDQKQLEILNLAGNLLVSSLLTPSLTQDMFSLMELNLESNQIDVLHPKVLSNLPNLQVLKLGSNLLQSLELPREMFQLRELNVSSNLLVEVNAGDIDGLDSLTLLSLANNRINSIHPAVFRNTSNILVLDISGNRLTEVPESFKYLTNLQTLDIGGNLISDFDNSPFQLMESLWRLQIHNNLLQNVSHESFSRMKSLQVVDMSRNQISRIDRGAFDQNKVLRAIRLDGNQLQEIEGIFTHLPELIWLNVSDNKIANFDYALVPRTLHWLDISHNQIKELGNYFDLDGDLALTYLDAGFNQLSSLSPQHLPDLLETVLLNDNEIRQVQPYTFFKKSKLVKVDLSVNEISSLTQVSLRLSSEILDLPSFLLGGNPIICDCEMQWFKTVNDNNSIQRYPVISDLESIYCRLVYTGEQSFIPLVEARNDQFLCSYETHCFSLCQCCQFDSCDCEMTCPDGCSCFHDNSWTKNIIQCSSGEFSSLPDNIPMDATEIFLDGNKLDILRSHTFIGRKNLKSLHLNNSNIEEIENLTFNGLQTLTSLHLENNKLQTLEGFEFSGLSYLRELYLNDNQISSIHDATFKSLKSLEVLFLQGNSIIDFPVWQLAFNPYLVSVRLAENLWNCDCEFMHKFQSWLKLSTTKVSDSELLTCISNDPEQENVLLTTDSDLPCDMSSVVAKNQKQEQGLENYMPLMIAVLASFSMIVILTFIVFGFRHSIRIWVSSKSSERMIESPEPSQQSEDGKLFDAYISYSPLDGPILNQVLPRDLENNYRICLHHRDLASNHLLSDSVHKVSNASKKIIIVLSQNYLQTEWARLDLKAGLLQTLSGGAQKLIFLVAGVIDPNFIDPTLRLLLKTGEVVSISEPSLMNRLEFSVPEFPDTHYYSTCKFPSMNQVSEKRIVSHI